MSIYKKTKEKICTLYVSDYHFEIVSLKYINDNIEKNRSIVIFTEDSLEESFNKLLGCVNFSKEKKDKLLEIDWDNNDNEKFNLINNAEKEIIVFIKGDETYMKNTHSKLNDIENSYNIIKIIDCYNIEDSIDAPEYIIQNYNKILKTSGEKSI